MIIPFGSYPVSRYGFKCPITWRVLDIEENEALLISHYGLDCKPYNHDCADITWEDCDLRKWLNNDFIKSAFSEEEVKKIKVSELNNKCKYSEKDVNETKDRVFCLSYNEKDLYFHSIEDKQCQATAYAHNQGVSVDNRNCCNWWLRSVVSMGRAHFVCSDGQTWPGGDYPFDRNYLAVRPALRMIIVDEEKKRRQIKEFQAQTYKNFLAIIEKGIQKGMIIPFGSYPQNENAHRVPIEWIVLDVKKPSLTNRLFHGYKIEALLISRYGLDFKMYNNNEPNILTWKDCDLRKWLNNDFIKTAFSEEEVINIKVSELNDKYKKEDENDTKDRVFCLSIDEAKQYFSSDKDRQCRPTAYAARNCIGSYSYCYWWLRSPYLSKDYGMYSGIYTADIVSTNGTPQKNQRVYESIFVRPALRIIF